MGCRRAGEIDFEAFLLDSGSEAFSDFRAHYTDCQDCSETVAQWTALDLALRDNLSAEAGVASPHPRLEELERHMELGRPKEGDSAQIEFHLAKCGSCRAELQLMSSFDGSALQLATNPGTAPPIHSPASASRPERAGMLASLRDALVPPSWSVLVPAAAILLILAFGLSQRQSPRNVAPNDAPTSPSVVERPSPETAPESPNAKPLDSPEIASPDSRVQVAETPEQKNPLAPEERGEIIARSTPEDSAQVEVPPSLAQSTPETAPVIAGHPESMPAPSDTPAPDADSNRKSADFLLAAMIELPLPSYAAPVAPGSADWMRQFGTMRFAQGSARVEAQAPRDHTGLTLRVAPRLWYTLKDSTDRTIQIMLVDNEAIEPLLLLDLPGPHTTGLFSVDLEEHGIRLQPEKDYRWFVSVLVDPERPSRNPVSAGALRLVPVNDERHTLLRKAEASERGHILAELGIWYDAFDFFASLSAAHPNVGRIREQRDHLAIPSGPK